MKNVILLALTLSSSFAWTKCPEISENQLNSDQIIVKNLLSSAYKFQAGESSNQNLIKFTILLKSKFTYAAEHLNNAEISSIIVEQDLENNICPTATYINIDTFTSIISDKIIDTYYGCGCEL